MWVRHYVLAPSAGLAGGGCLDALHRELLRRLRAADRIDWSRACMDSASLAAKRMARPVGKWFLRSGIGSLRQRIRSQGRTLAKMEIRASHAS